MADRLYTITGQNQVRALDAQSNLIDVYEIHYEGPNLVRGNFRMPVSVATPDAVDNEIRRRLANQLAIGELGSL